MFEKGDIMETIRNVDVNRLHDFKNHPFKVEMNTELCELMRSIEKEGVLVPLLVRTNPYGDGYEVISGHRRKEAAIWAGETKVPVVIRELDDDQAVVAMVDSNLHRENLKPSEKAFAYKMKLDAMKHQGKHLDSGDPLRRRFQIVIFAHFRVLSFALPRFSPSPVCFSYPSFIAPLRLYFCPFRGAVFLWWQVLFSVALPADL